MKALLLGFDIQVADSTVFLGLRSMYLPTAGMCAESGMKQLGSVVGSG